MIRKIDIQSQIRDIISEKFAEASGKQQQKSANNPRLTQDLIVKEIRKKGIVDSIMNGIKFEHQIHQSNLNHSLFGDKLNKSNASILHENQTNSKAPKFLDKNQEFAVPLNKGEKKTLNTIKSN